MRSPVILLTLIVTLAACAGRTAAPDDPKVFVRMSTTAGDIILELDREHAPVSVANFLEYAQRGAYDGTIFHRVIPDFVIQGGGFDANLVERAKLDAEKGNPDKPIRNEWQNGLKNIRGTIAMARDPEPDTATREFYINLADNAKLDTARETTGHAGYAVFGKVIAGMDVVDTIKSGKTMAIPDRDMKDVPVKPVVIQRVQRISTSEARRAAVVTSSDSPGRPAGTAPGSPR
jgi:cyclophilin family peptidyl-prolyl cis-trans isomerase